MRSWVSKAFSFAFSFFLRLELGVFFSAGLAGFSPPPPLSSATAAKSVSNCLASFVRALRFGLGLASVVDSLACLSTFLISLFSSLSLSRFVLARFRNGLSGILGDIAALPLRFSLHLGLHSLRHGLQFHHSFHSFGHFFGGFLHMAHEHPPHPNPLSCPCPCGFQPSPLAPPSPFPVLCLYLLYLYLYLDLFPLSVSSGQIPGKPLPALEESGQGPLLHPLHPGRLVASWLGPPRAVTG